MIDAFSQSVEIPLWTVLLMWSYRGEAGKVVGFLREANGIRRIKKYRRENETPGGNRE